MGTIATKAVMNNPDGTMRYRQEHEWVDLSPEGEKALMDGIEKQTKFLEDLKAKQNKTPDAIYSAVLSCTGQPDLTFDAFTYDMYQKAHHSWNQVTEELLRLGEKALKGKGKP